MTQKTVEVVWMPWSGLRFSRNEFVSQDPYRSAWLRKASVFGRTNEKGFLVVDRTETVLPSDLYRSRWLRMVSCVIATSFGYL